MSDLREALDGVLVDDDGVVHFPAHRGKARGQAVIVAAARRFLALTETGPDYEAAFDHYLTETGSCRQKAMEGAVDAALADYLTEETK